MKRILLAALLAPLAFIQAQPTPPSLTQPRKGGFKPTPTDSPVVLDAKAFLQSQLSTMTLTEVLEAEVQVVAGLKVRLLCAVTGDDGASTWQFLAFRSLDGRWHFQGANRTYVVPEEAASPLERQSGNDSGCLR